MSFSEKSILLQAMFLFLAVKVCLPAFRLRGTRRLLNEAQRWLPTTHGTSLEVIVRLVDIASARCFRGPACLPRALVAQNILRRSGYEPQLCIGAARGTEGEFQAHAWLQADGRVVFGGTPEDVHRYVPFAQVDELTV